MLKFGQNKYISTWKDAVFKEEKCLMWSNYAHKVMSESPSVLKKKETGILILGQSCRTTWHLAVIVQKWFFTGIMLVNVIYKYTYLGKVHPIN